MEKNTRIRILEAVMADKLSQFAAKYSDEVVIKAWEEIRKANGEEAYIRFCEWKTEMTLMEALGCLDEYCEFVEAMIRKHLQKEGRVSSLAPAVFN